MHEQCHHMSHTANQCQRVAERTVAIPHEDGTESRIPYCAPHAERMEDLVQQDSAA